MVDTIYMGLHYHLAEIKIMYAGLKSDQEFPRKFGPWGEIWEDKQQAIRTVSPYRHFPSYKCRSIIVKGGDDLRQELMIMQVIRKFQQIF